MPSTMSPRERFLSACSKKPTDRPPAWMMRQAGRYLPEYRELRQSNDFLTMVHNPKLAAEVTLQPIRRYGMDAAVIFCDILVPAEAMGVQVDFVEGKGPVLQPVLREAADIDRLHDFDPRKDTAFLADAIRLVREELGDERAIVGFCGAPFTLASYMIEGGGSRNYENTRSMMLAQPEAFDRLIERIVDNSIPYLEMQFEAGADVVQIFDSWGGALDAATYRERILPGVSRMVSALQKKGAPVILYANGCSHLLEVLADSGADVLGIDWRIDPAQAIERVGSRVALQGNLDPTILFSTPEVVRREAQRVLDGFREQEGYIFNLGSGILPKAPLENVQALWDTVLADR
ncbi:MAG: uroporphyrinogen decarboxylase [Planctomycetota bacterium]|jgi:uroporphyrinogen decarboxylase